VSDQSVCDALRSDAALVVIEAPGGCGKTYQGAAYACEAARSSATGRLLVLTHTHAACSVFDSRTRSVASLVDIRTIDSLITEFATAYHRGLGIPADAGTWARRNKDGYDWLAVKAAALVKRFPATARTLACRYSTIICDEHQDSTGERHAFIMAIHEQGAKLRVFADPMQTVFSSKAYPGGCPALDWEALTKTAGRFEELDHPHRWANGCTQLGRWVLSAREALKRGDAVDLRQGRPPSVTVVHAENQAQRPLEYRPLPRDRRPIDDFVDGEDSVMLLTRHNAPTNSLRPFFNRRIPLWEGHTRSALEKYVDALAAADGDRNAVAVAVVALVQEAAVGFTDADFANSLRQDVAEGCRRARRMKPAKVQTLARMIVDQPDHRGASNVLARIAELRANDDDFKSIQIDSVKEFYEGARLGDYDSAEIGFVEISRRRAHSRSSPPIKTISTIHKSKGLECNSAVIAPCDARALPNNKISRCLLYVAMSRPTHRLMFVLPRKDPSPLLLI
jgi:UvrD-like helicase C-terminal domain/AAA domain